MVKVVEQMPRPGEHSTAGGVKIFVQRYVDCIKQRCVSLRRDASVGASQEQPGAVQMERDLPLTGECGDPLHLRKIEDLADDATHGGLDRNHSDRCRDTAFLSPHDFELNLG